jgi:hypothetical protein
MAGVVSVEFVGSMDVRIAGLAPSSKPRGRLERDVATGWNVVV